MWRIGNASLVLHELGVTPVTVDISPEMLNIYRRKAKACGYEAETKGRGNTGVLTG